MYSYLGHDIVFDDIHIQRASEDQKLAFSCLDPEIGCLVNIDFRSCCSVHVEYARVQLLVSLKSVGSRQCGTLKSIS